MTGAPFPYGEPVEVLSYQGSSGEDSFGNDTETWADSGLVWEGCAIDSQSTEPIATDRDPMLRVGKVYGPAEMTVGLKDKVKIRGQVWEVVGQVWMERNPFSGDTPGVWFGIQRMEQP